MASYTPRTRRSYWLFFGDVTAFHTGFIILDASTILPVFLATLTDSSFIIGLVIALKPIGMFIPQIWTAHKMQSRRLLKPFLVKVASISRIGVSLLSMLLFMVRPDQKGLILVAFLIVYSALWLSEGLAMVPWNDIVGKTIPDRLRGRLFGNTQALGAAFSSMVGLFAAWILSSKGPGYPMNYGTLMFTAAFFMSISYVCVSLVPEPEGEIHSGYSSLSEYTVALGKLVKSRPEFTRFLLVTVMLGCFGMASPFFVLYAQDAAGLSAGSIGKLLTAQVIGLIIFTTIAGYINDHIGPRAAIFWTLACGFIPCLLAALFGTSGLYLWMLIFVMIGAFTGSIWVGTTGYLLESAVPEDRKSYICLLHLFNGLTALFPVVGGLVADWFSYHTVFVFTLVLLSVTFIAALGLRPIKKTLDSTDYN